MAKAWQVVGRWRWIAVFAAVGTIVAGGAAAIDTGPRITDPWRDWITGIAIGGYDPVAYFVNHAPRLGERRYEMTLEGVTWRFASAANRAVFRRDPQVYTPRFGGRDPVQLGEGFATPGNPLEWTIEADRLYLFTSAETRAQWLGADPAMRAAARANWPAALAATQ